MRPLVRPQCAQRAIERGARDTLFFPLVLSWAISGGRCPLILPSIGLHGIREADPYQRGRCHLTPVKNAFSLLLIELSALVGADCSSHRIRCALRMEIHNRASVGAKKRPRPVRSGSRPRSNNA